MEKERSIKTVWLGRGRFQSILHRVRESAADMDFSAAEERGTAPSDPAYLVVWVLDNNLIPTSLGSDCLKDHRCLATRVLQISNFGNDRQAAGGNNVNQSRNMANW